MIQLILHLIGDYITQSDWMARNKMHSNVAAIMHATVYALPFLLIGSPLAVFVIWWTHFCIDRFRLAKYVVFAKNWIGCFDYLKPRWEECNGTGYPPGVPAWMAVWLLIIADNTLHLTINCLALKFL